MVKMWVLENERDLNNYAFKNSPGSCSDNSYCTENMDIVSDEDFITQLSNDLDIPLFLNPGEDELSVLNSFLDKSPEEILSDIASPPRMDTLPNESTNLSLDFSNWEASYPNIHTQLKVEDHSEDSNSNLNLFEPLSPISTVSVKKSNSPVNIKPDIKAPTSPSNYETKLPIKRVPIKPKASPISESSVVVIKNELPQLINSPNVLRGASQLVVVNGKTAVPINNISGINRGISPPKHVVSPVTIINKGFNVGVDANIDLKIFKKHQRKIKNRESASLSRKRKKDYLNSLEDKVKDLTAENERLVAENAALKEKLSLYEGKFTNIPGKNAKLALCVFLLIVGINFDFLRNPFTFKNSLNTVQSNLPKLTDHHGRTLLWTSDESISEEIKNNTLAFLPSTMCPAYINQTESARLVLELEKLIGKPSEQTTNRKPSPPSKAANQRIKQRKKKKIRVDSPIEKLKKEYGPVIQRTNEIQVFLPKPEHLYSDFFEAINRKDDTFYVVSFNEHHMLLPALYHNKTTRPKMSLLMPSVLPNSTSQQNYVPLMQIDCEVLDTKLVNVNYGAIPRQYRNNGNVTKEEGEKVHQTARTDNISSNQYDKKPYKPYFLYKKLTKHSEQLKP